MRGTMIKDFGWSRVADEYISLYRVGCSVRAPRASEMLFCDRRGR